MADQLNDIEKLLIQGKNIQLRTRSGQSYSGRITGLRYFPHSMNIKDIFIMCPDNPHLVVAYGEIDAISAL